MKKYLVLTLTVLFALLFTACGTAEETTTLNDCGVTFADTIEHGKSLMNRAEPTTEVQTTEETTEENHFEYDERYLTKAVTEICPCCGKSITLTINVKECINFDDPLTGEFVTSWTPVTQDGHCTCSCGNEYHYEMGLTGGDAWWNCYEKNENTTTTTTREETFNENYDSGDYETSDVDIFGLDQDGIN